MSEDDGGNFRRCRHHQPLPTQSSELQGDTRELRLVADWLDPLSSHRFRPIGKQLLPVCVCVYDGMA
jgi:hypothetical protein